MGIKGKTKGALINRVGRGGRAGRSVSARSSRWGQPELNAAPPPIVGWKQQNMRAGGESDTEGVHNGPLCCGREGENLFVSA